MTYLSRLLLNARNHDVRSDLSDCHELHRTILSAFPPAPLGLSPREHFGVLHRIDLKPSGPALLVQSATEPNWRHLPDGYLAANSEPNPACKLIDSLVDAIEEGRSLVFRLRANPTKKVPDRITGSKNGKRVELRDEGAQLAWLRRKGESGGFVLVDVRVSPGVPNVRTTEAAKQTGRRGEGNHTSMLTFGSVVFDGELRVTHTPLFRDTLCAGIGSGKAYGFGLLSVAPLS